MLNANNERELAYVARVDAIEPIPEKDRVECAVVGGWRTMVRKGQFKPGDIGIYFEIDTQVPEKECFEFLAKYHYKIKTQKFKTFYSQGLLMHPLDFKWDLGVTLNENTGAAIPFIIDTEGKEHYADGESRFLTKQLEVTYATIEDNKRKKSSEDKYKKMAQRRSSLFKKKWARWMMKRNWGKKIMFFFFGRKKDKKNGWPSWVVKTDEERVQNMPWVFTDPAWHDESWYATEKIDGTSTTFTLKRGELFHKDEYYVCSRNVCFDTPEKADKCFYDSNVYLEMSQKYNIECTLKDILQYHSDLNFVTLQGETYGDGIQKRTYSLAGGEHRFMAFNLIYGFTDGTTKRFNPDQMTKILEKYNIPCVPIISTAYMLPLTCDILLTRATGKSTIDGEMREGIVFRDSKGERSFKAVSNEFLIKYHQ